MTTTRWITRLQSNHGGASAVPRWWPARVYYGWAMVGTLGVTVATSYGILAYAFSVFLAPMSSELGWSKTQITGAFSLAQGVAGVSAFFVGRWVDRHGARGLMTAGSALAAVLLVAWSNVDGLWAYYLIFGAFGLALAAVFYEPAFAVVATWFRRDRDMALTLLTFMGGFASVIFVPLAAFLVSSLGWRAALRILALVLAGLTILPHALVLRPRPEDLGLIVDGGWGSDRTRSSAPSRWSRWSRWFRGAQSTGALASERSVTADIAIRSRAFQWAAIAFALSGLTTTAVSVHLVPLLIERGYDMRIAATAMALLGLMALPGRLVFTPLGGRWQRPAVTASIFMLQALALVALLTSRSAAAIWVFALLFGAGLGAITPARAALLAELFGPAHFGKISGVIAFLVCIARAVAPVGASAVYAGARPGHGYDVVLLVLLALCLVSGAAVLLAGNADAQARASLPFNHSEEGTQ